MRKEDDVKFTAEEDDGFEIKEKVEIIPDEVDEKPKKVLTKEEQKKAKFKKIGLILLCIVVVLVIFAVVYFLFFNKKISERILPVDVTDNGSYTQEDYNKPVLTTGEWYISSNEAYPLFAVATSLIGIYDIPHVSGFAVASINQGEEFVLLGEVMDKNGFYDWFYVRYGDKKGFIKSDGFEFLYYGDEDLGLDLEDEEDKVDLESLAEEEREFYHKKLINNISNLNKTDKQIAEKNKQLQEIYARINEISDTLNQIPEDFDESTQNEERDKLMQEYDELQEKIDKIQEEINNIR